MSTKNLSNIVKKLFAALDHCDEFNDYSSFDFMEYKDLWNFFKIDTSEYENRM